ncbi:MAG: glycosyltransferase [Egibacteraceae bacterium]
MMRVLFLQQLPCIRTLKYAAGLRTALPQLQLGFAYRGQTLSGFYGAGDELFDRWWQLGDDPTADLRKVVSAFRPDLIHSHNLPDELTVLALEAVGDRVPVIHDVHDFQSLRNTPYRDGFPEPEDPLTLEKQAIERSAALVAVSDELLAEIASRYRLPSHSLVFGSYVVGASLPVVLPPPVRARSGPWQVVYQGTLFSDGGHYDLREIFRGIASGGVALHVYPARPAPEYETLPGIRCHATLDPYTLLRTLPRYDFGWAGFNASLNGAHLDTVLPNKLYEYVGCGLPVLTLSRHRALDRFVRTHGVGLSLTDLADLGPALDAADVPALRRRVAELRDTLTVERNIHHLVALYETVLS